ncbi:NfeD family protein [Oceanicella actignis]|uniref:NfeD family protein n=1 Tax=Oceanicella actignis TaxID=1189325 RepID=UPI0011E63372|nr:NfeD family protein [Oceanicella actignis]TYO91202.1 hypothetical protein LY05_00053 [Oceanicella actignis]
MDIFAFLDGASPWGWAALAVGLAAVEMLIGSFFLLWPALAAALTAMALIYAPDLSGAAQIGLFSGAAALLTLGGRWAARRLGAARSGRPELNRREARLTGRVAVAVEPFEAGEGAVEIDGVRWRARAAPDARIDKGARLRVRRAEGMTLIVAPVNH